MADLQTYYQDIRAKRAELTKDFIDGWCMVMSVYNREKNSTAGTLTQVSVERAAQVITDGTHRLASDAEIATYTKAQEEQRAVIAAAELTRARAVQRPFGR